MTGKSLTAQFPHRVIRKHVLSDHNISLTEPMAPIVQFPHRVIRKHGLSDFNGTLTTNFKY